MSYSMQRHLNHFRLTALFFVLSFGLQCSNGTIVTGGKCSLRQKVPPISPFRPR